MARTKLSADQSRIVTPPSVVIAGGFGATGFAIAVLSGTFADRAIADVLADAILAMLLCYPVGFAAGKIATIAIDECAEQHRSKRPLPSMNAAVNPVNDGGREGHLSDGRAS